ncbi:MAG: NUDIX hydrolase, partial [Desulfobacterales bacterium]|nr:NUDIX hydrolase [Desulfobacterales bacterium]
KIGFWCLPGGFIELGETPEQGALRELKEETSLSGKIEMLLGVTTNISPKYQSVLMVGYLVKNYNGILKPGDDAADAAYYNYNDLPEIAFESHMSFIRIYYSAYAI